MKFSIQFILAFTVTSLIAISSHAANIYVDDNAAPGGDGSLGHPFQYIQDGMDAAVNGDTVIVLDGIYKGPGNKNLDFKGKAITVTSQNGPDNAIIDCEKNGRGFYFHSGEGPDSVINGLTIRNGNIVNGSGGVAIHCHDSSPKISNNVIVSNQAFSESSGGIIYLYKSSAIIDNNSIINNSVNVYNSIISCLNSYPAVIDNVISGNYIGDGTISGKNCPSIIISGNKIQGNMSDSSMILGIGISFYDCSYIMITENSITKNRVANKGDKGGGIYCKNSLYITIQKNTISDNNIGYGEGGGIYLDNCTSAIIVDNIISKNVALNGNGIFCSGSTIISGNTITGNSGIRPIYDGGEGGGIYCSGFTIISGNNISNNDAGDNGGGICCKGITKIVGNTIKDNKTWSGNVHPGGGIYCSGSVFISGNIITKNTGDLEVSGGGGIFILGNPDNIDLGNGITGSPGLNSIYDNSPTDVSFSGNGTVLAENNWWGISPPNPLKLFRNIDYTPWLTEPPAPINIQPVAGALYINPRRPLSSEDLTANYIYFDADKDPENGTEIRWYKDGVLQEAYNDLLEIPSTATSKGEKWHFTVKPKDGKEFGELQISGTVTINREPAVSNVYIGPSSPLTNDNLVANYTYSDPEGDPENGTEIKWYKDTILQSGFTNQKIVPASATLKGEQWYFTVRPKDGISFGELRVAAPVMIQNTPPIASELFISPAAPMMVDNLTANYKYFDADNDPENGTEIKWYKNGILQDEYNNILVVPSSSISPGETWYFTVMPKDGIDPGNVKTSPSVKIGRVALSIPAASSFPNASIDVPVEIGDVTGLGILAVEFILTYKSNILTVKNITTSGTIAQSWGNPTYVNSPGKTVLSMAGVEALTGSGKLLNISFSISSSAKVGDTSPIDFIIGRLNEGNINVSLRGGIFTVAENGTYGDVSGDGKITSYDGALVLQNTVGMIQFTPYQKNLGDVSGNGDISAYDAALILQYAVGLIDRFPVENKIQSEVLFSHLYMGSIIDLPAEEIVNSSYQEDSISSAINANIPNTNGSSGSIITIPVNITDSTGYGIIGIDINIAYNSDILTAEGIQSDGTIASGWNILSSVKKGQIAIGMMSPTALSGPGNLIKIVFRVSNKAKFGENSLITFSSISFNEGAVEVSTTNGKFTVIPSGPVSIKISAPNGGENIKGGTIYNIKWSTSENGFDHIQLMYSTDSGLTYQNIVNNTESDVIYEWYPVPSVNSDKARVKIIAMDKDNNVLAEDVSDNDFTIDSTQPSAQQELYLYPGWNLISIGLDTGETRLLSVLKPVEGLYRSIWGYDTNLGWKSYLPDTPGSPDDLEDIIPGKGYWIEMKNEAILTIMGIPLSNKAISLYKGWNLVSYNSLTMKNIEDALTSISGDCSFIWGYDSFTKIWLGFNSEGIPMGHFLSKLLSGKGYYIYVKKDCEWNLLP